MVKKVTVQTRAKASAGRKRRRQREVLAEEERLLREATQYLVFQHGMFLVASSIRETRIKGFRVWIITVTLRYATGTGEVSAAERPGFSPPGPPPGSRLVSRRLRGGVGRRDVTPFFRRRTPVAYAASTAA